MESNPLISVALASGAIEIMLTVMTLNRIVSGFCLSVLPLLSAIAADSALASERLFVCHGYSCYYKTRLDFGAGDIRHIASIMRSGSSSPETERRAVSRVVQYFERRATAAVGVMDRPKSDFGRGRERGQMDCVDESTNTSGLLKLMSSRGMFRYHTVSRRVSRGFFADGRYPHFTAVIVDPRGEKWVVDSWYEPGGGAPDIMPLSRWQTRGGGGGR